MLEYLHDMDNMNIHFEPFHELDNNNSFDYLQQINDKHIYVVLIDIYFETHNEDKNSIYNEKLIISLIMVSHEQQQHVLLIHSVTEILRCNFPININMN